jgi:SHS2 domain-containing protein
MEELVYLSEDAELVPEGLERLDLGEGRLEATVLARPGRPRHLVKAVTYHRLDFRSDGDMWVARVVLDV